MNDTGLRVELRTYLSQTHLENAVLLALKSRELEQSVLSLSGHDIFTDQNKSTNFCYVINSLFSITAFLEATINEIITDSVLSRDRSKRSRLSGSTALQLSDNILHELSIEYHRTQQSWGSIFQKYGRVLEIAGATRIESNAGTLGYYAGAIPQIRNKLVHYSPETIISWDTITETGIDNTGTICERLEGMILGQFELNPFSGELEPFFPNRCLSAGCAIWAIRKSVEYVNEFIRRLGLNTSMFSQGRQNALSRIL